MPSRLNAGNLDRFVSLDMRTETNAVTRSDLADSGGICPYAIDVQQQGGSFDRFDLHVDAII